MSILTVIIVVIILHSQTELVTRAEVLRCKPLVEAQAGQAVQWTSIGGNAGYLNFG